MTETNGNGASHLAWLRTRHDALTADRTMDYEVPGYDGRLVLRFAPVPWSAIAKTQALANRDDRDGRALAAANMDVLIAACRQVMFRDDAGDLASVDPSGDPHRRRIADVDATHGRRNVGSVRGGIEGVAAIRAAAMLCVLGVDGVRLLTTDDRTEAMALQAMGQEAARIQQQRDKALAAEIANAVGRLFK
jgi:hypothetical protein